MTESKTKIIPVRFDVEDLQRLKSEAQKLKISLSTLIRMKVAKMFELERKFL
jgi:hypothetical protein